MIYLSILMLHSMQVEAKHIFDNQIRSKTPRNSSIEENMDTFSTPRLRDQIAQGLIASQNDRSVLYRYFYLCDLIGWERGIYIYFSPARPRFEHIVIISWTDLLYILCLQRLARFAL